MVKCDNAEVGRLTADLLIERMQSADAPPRDAYVATEFLSRGSLWASEDRAVTSIFIPDTEAAERMAMERRLSALPGVSVRLGERFSTPAAELGDRDR